MKKAIALIAAFVLIPAYALAVELTLDDCINMALGRNSGLMAYKMDVRTTEQDVRIAKAKFLPSLKLHGHYSLFDDDDIFMFKRDVFAPGIPPNDVEFSADNQNMYGLDIVIEQPVFTGGMLTHSYRKSKLLNEETQHQAERQKKILTFQVKKTFYEVLREQLVRKTLQKVLEHKQERLRVARELRQEGYLLKDELLQMENDLETSELDLFVGKNREALALSRLIRLIYYQEDDQVTIQETPRMKQFLAASLTEVKESALRNREELMMAQAKIKASDEAVSIAQSGYYPQAYLQGSYTAQKETNVTRPEIWSLSAQMEWPLFEWGRTRSEVRKAEASRLRQQYVREDLEQNILIEVEEAWRAVRNREKEVELQESLLKTSEIKYHRALEQFHEKTIKLADLLQTESELIKSYNDYLSSIHAHAISISELELSASIINDRWFSEAEIYRPDLDILLQRKNVSRRRDGRPENPASENASRDTNAENQPSVEIQVGALKDYSRAEKLKEKIVKKTEGKTVKIIAQEGFHKVRIEGFREKEDAQQFAERSGISNYLIVKSVTDSARFRKNLSSSPSPAAPAADTPEISSQQDSALSDGSGKLMGTIMIQVVSFKEKQNAEKARDRLLKTIVDKHINILSQGGFYKIRVSGFSDSNEAEKFADSHKIRNYLIVRHSE